MKATIAIATYNRTKYIEGVLACAINQHFDDYEVLLGDSSETDSVLDAAEPYFTDGKMRYLRFPPQTLLIAKFNALLREARGEWMVFLCDDDLLDTDYLSTLLEHAKNQPLATLIRCRFKIINEDGDLLRMDPISKTVMGPAEFLSRLFHPGRGFFRVNLSGILFHRKTFLEEGGFSQFPSAFYSDLLAWAIVGSRGLSIFEKKALASIRVHSNSRTFSSEESIHTGIQTNLGVLDEIRHLLKRLEKEVNTQEDREFLRIAEKNAKDYMRNYMSLVFDRGFMTALLTDRQGLKEYLRSLFETMKKMEVPVFRSARVYSWLGHLNYFIRRPVLDAFKQYKTKKWCN